MTQQTKHTPGPWAISTLAHIHNSIGGALGTGYRVHFDGPDHHWHVATVFGQLDENEPPATMQGHAIANARLIAAAPELLAACEAVWLMTPFDSPERRQIVAAMASAKGR